MRFVYGWEIGWHRVGTIGYGELWTDCELTLNEVHQIMTGRPKQTGKRKLSPFGNCNESAMWAFELWQNGKNAPRVLKLTRQQR